MASTDQTESLLAANPPPADRYLSAEGNPWRSITYILMTLQVMVTLLDLFLESGYIPAVHYTITALQFVPALYLTMYQIIRIRGLFKYRHATLEEEGVQLNEFSRKPYIYLFIAFFLHLYVLVVSAMWFDISLDVNSHNLEWSVFAVVLVNNLVNPLTYSSVVELAEAEESKKKKEHMGPGAAVVSVFSKHFMREKLLFVTGALAAVAQAILTTSQGAAINQLTRMVTRMKFDKNLNKMVPEYSFEEVELTAATLIGLWAGANIARFTFDLLSSLMFSRLEVCSSLCVSTVSLHTVKMHILFISF